MNRLWCGPLKKSWKSNVKPLKKAIWAKPAEKVEYRMSIVDPDTVEAFKNIIARKSNDIIWNQ